MVNVVELDVLKGLVAALELAYISTKRELEDSIRINKLQVDAYGMRDSNGRYILADVTTAYANAYVSYLYLKEKYEASNHLDDAVVSAPRALEPDPRMVRNQDGETPAEEGEVLGVHPRGCGCLNRQP